MYVQQAGEVMIGSDHFNIDFQPSQHENDKKALWAQNITWELAWRLLPVTGTLFDHQQRLRGHLVDEHQSCNVTQILADGEPKD